MSDLMGGELSMGLYRNYFLTDRISFWMNESATKPWELKHHALGLVLICDNKQDKVFFNTCIVWTYRHKCTSLSMILSPCLKGR